MPPLGGFEVERKTVHSPCGLQAEGEEVAEAVAPAIATIVVRMMLQLTARLASAPPLPPPLARPRLGGDIRAYPAIG